MRIRYEIYNARLEVRITWLRRNDIHGYKRSVLKIKDDLRDLFISMEDTVMDVFMLSVNEYEYLMKSASEQELSRVIREEQRYVRTYVLF